MLDLAILAILLIGLLIGLKRGFILQTVHMTGFIVAFIVAYVFYGDLAPNLKLWIPFPTMSDSSALTMFLKQSGSKRRITMRLPLPSFSLRPRSFGKCLARCSISLPTYRY